MGGFSDLLEKVKNTSEAAAAEKLRDTLERAKCDDHLKYVYEHLSESAKRTLERVKEDKKDIKRDEWLGLCRELKDAGIITKSEFDYTRADVHLIPLGYTDKSGNFVKYTTSPMMQEKLRSLSGQSRNFSLSNREMWLSSDSWSGDPLEYLNSWITMLYDWRSGMARTRAEDGSIKFNDFSPINDQIDSCQRVSALIGRLCEF